MTFFDQFQSVTPTGLRKFLFVNWPLVLLLSAVSSIGFLMLYSVAGGTFDPWARPQMVRFGVGIVLMFFVAFTHVRFWRSITPFIYIGAVLLLVAVDVMGSVGMGAQRWINLGFIRLQPSEVAKIAVVMALAMYYDWLDITKVSRPFWVILPLLMTLAPAALTLIQPDLGTALLIIASGGVIMFLAGVSIWYFIAAIVSVGGIVATVLLSWGTSWQLLKDYQYRRIETFLNPDLDPLGAGYHISQSKIALGSGGFEGRGFMQGTQTRLNFLPEKHTDFIFTTLAEEFGYVGSTLLLVLYVLIIGFSIHAMLINKDRFGALLIGGVAATFFFYFAINMGMVMGLLPVVGVPLPLVSYGGSAMLVLLGAFGLVQSAHIHRPRS